MAILVSPTGINFGSSTAPASASVVIADDDLSREDIADGQQTYTREVLASPSLNQLANLSAGYAI